MAISVAVITRDHDITADPVVAELQRRGERIARFDLSDFPERLTQIAYLVDGRTRWTGALRGHHRDVDLSKVRAVWWRKPSVYAVDPTMTATEQQWAAAEASYGFGGLLAALPVRWVNHPHRIAAAEHKPHQLSAAAEAGLTVPDSLLTNDPDQARDFCAAYQDVGVVYKPLRGGPGTEASAHAVLRTTRVRPHQISDAVRRTTHLFQAEVPGVAVRMTVVGCRLFAVCLDPPAGGSAVDWRTYRTEDLRLTPVEVPAQVSAGVHRLMDTFGLVYAAPDFIVAPDGQWVFCGDLNPNGQWGWVAARTGLPIAQSLADELTKEHNP